MPVGTRADRQRLGYNRAMIRLVSGIFIVGHVALVLIYWVFSGDSAGTAMLAIFGVAMVLMGRILIPTFNDVGATAPVDPDWHESPRP